MAALTWSPREDCERVPLCVTHWERLADALLSADNHHRHIQLRNVLKVLSGPRGWLSAFAQQQRLTHTRC